MYTRIAVTLLLLTILCKPLFAADAEDNERLVVLLASEPTVAFKENSSEIEFDTLLKIAADKARKKNARGISITLKGRGTASEENSEKLARERLNVLMSYFQKQFPEIPVTAEQLPVTDVDTPEITVNHRLSQRREVEDAEKVILRRQTERIVAMLEELESERPGRAGTEEQVETLTIAMEVDEIADGR